MNIEITSVDNVKITYLSYGKDKYRILSSYDDELKATLDEVQKESWEYIEGSEGNVESGPKEPAFDSVWTTEELWIDMKMSVEDLLKYHINMSAANSDILEEPILC